MGVKYFESVMDYFKEISAIPRCSQQEEKISDYLLQFAKVKKLEAYRDDMLNVIIKKPATPGYEKSPTVILQGHMDMVCEKNKGMDHDFEKDPIKIVIDGDLLKAEGTTLGADNGIAVAFCLAILDAKDIPHPPLEVLITSQEEVGLLGASALDASKLQGKILINIDAEDEGVLFTSCAGGVRSAITLPILWKEATGDAIYEIKIGGLKGGHSGMEIDKHRANANKLLGRVLKDIFEACDIDIASVSGGMKVNAIPREAAAQITFDEGLYPLVAEKIAAWDRLLKNELKSSDKGMSLTLEKMDGSIDKVFSRKTIKDILSLYTLIPSGVMSMSASIEGLVESSTNLGVVTTDDGQIEFLNSTRSSVSSLKDSIVEQLSEIATILGANMENFASYPAWEYKEESYIRDLFVRVYRELHAIEPVITAIHAGLECGILGEKLGDIDMIAFGPQIYDVHSPDERVSIKSIESTWAYLCEVLKKIR